MIRKTRRAAQFVVVLAFTVLGSAPARAAAAFDFNNDGRSDILWRNATTGENYFYPMNGTSVGAGEGYVRTVADQNWEIVGVGNFDGTGGADLLWRNSATGENYIYLMNGTAIAGEGYIRTVSDLDWQVAGVGDFDGDGKSDILWRNLRSGENYIYLMNGTTIAGEGYIRAVADPNWQVVGVGDFDGDSKSDVLWRNASSGQNYIYPMNGLAIKATEGYIRTVADQNWQVAGVGNFDGLAGADILWRNRSTGENYVYLMNGTAISGEGYIRTVADASWQVAGVGDYDGDTKADVLWRNTATGDNYLYPMDGAAILPSEGYVRRVADQNWRVAGKAAQDRFQPARAVCDATLASNASDAFAYAQAMDLCQSALENPLGSPRWGVISAQLLLADGTGSPAAQSRSIRPSFGSGNLPQFGNRLVLLSTGNAAASGQTNPPFAAFQPGQSIGTQSAFPADWYAAHNSTLPNAPGCPPPSGTTAFDPVMLKLRIRVPSNAHSFSVAARFFSSEFPEYVCSPYNDFFVALLDSSYNGASPNPSDKNLARYVTPSNAVYPVGVNLASGNTGLFQACVNGRTGCASVATAGTISTCTETASLIGTSLEAPDPGSCDANSRQGGGTAWLTIRGNVVPGETIELRFAIWDTGDATYDSLVLLDNFQWSDQTTTPGAFLGP